jgi:hypothetical protein
MHQEKSGNPDRSAQLAGVAFSAGWPDLATFRPIGYCFLCAVFLITEVDKKILDTIFHDKSYV